MENQTLISETGKAGKFRTTTKEFSSPEQALSALEKKEWESLKKGFVYHNPDAPKGEAKLHKFISSGYTGALSFVQAADNFFVYGCGKTEEDPDILLKINQKGETLNEFSLPQILAWEMEFQKEKNQILLNLDHEPYSFSVENETFIKSSEKIKKISPCKKYWVECARNKVKVFSTESQEVIKTIETEYDFLTIESIGFSDKYLIIKDLPMPRVLKFYDLQTFNLLEMKGLEIPEQFSDVIGFCVSPDGRYLVQRRYNFAYLFDLHQEKFLYSFEIWHLVKSCKMQFLDAGLGIRTDYGCFSIYEIAINPLHSDKK